MPAVEKKIAKANGISARESGELVTIHGDGAEIRNATGERCSALILIRSTQPITTTAGQIGPPHSTAYDLGVGGNFQPSSPTAMTASVRLDTFNALRIAVT